LRVRDVRMVGFEWFGGWGLGRVKYRGERSVPKASPYGGGAREGRSRTQGTGSCRVRLGGQQSGERGCGENGRVLASQICAVRSASAPPSPLSCRTKQRPGGLGSASLGDTGPGPIFRPPPLSPLCLVIGEFQALPPDRSNLFALGIDVRRRGQRTPARRVAGPFASRPAGRSVDDLR